MSTESTCGNSNKAQKEQKKCIRALEAIAQLGRGKKRRPKSAPKSIPGGDWCRVSEYAKRVGITRQAAYLRVKRGHVESMVLAGVMLVKCA